MACSAEAERACDSAAFACSRAERSTVASCALGAVAASELAPPAALAPHSRSHLARISSAVRMYSQWPPAGSAFACGLPIASVDSTISLTLLDWIVEPRRARARTGAEPPQAARRASRLPPADSERTAGGATRSALALSGASSGSF